jgi:hypothetical protein
VEDMAAALPNFPHYQIEGNKRTVMDQSTPATSLVLPETIERLLISSTAPFIGEFKSEAVVFTHVLPGPYDRIGSFRGSAGPFSRSAFMLSFDAPEVTRISRPVPTAGDRRQESWFICLNRVHPSEAPW